ncbi:MAG: thermonuclease family protein [Xanthobacteraceae bacterium]|nr:thermonuclease family protein [Xanthobacteraceae bacterium]MBX3548763.1 thermonuclease family protein [Xanthobacteraceae bacterium]MCW5674397.1 thermonuclease family protein [Xanthobacteraceae bacterium]MCW5678713.1 thermonuclease family protein [Xanthobacteraceae bacterium]
MNLRRLAPWIFVLLIAAGFVVWNFYFDRAVRIDKDGRGIVVQDGDSFIIQQTTIRLDGIDAPELKQNCFSADGSIWRCGGEARNQLAKLLRKGDVKCEPRAKDVYGRTIAKCSARDVPDIAEEIVRLGWAINAADIGQGKYSAAEEEAKAAKRGIWQGAFERPKVYRLQHPREDAPKKN